MEIGYFINIIIGIWFMYKSVEGRIKVKFRLDVFFLMKIFVV